MFAEPKANVLKAGVFPPHMVVKNPGFQHSCSGATDFGPHSCADGSDINAAVVDIPLQEHDAEGDRRQRLPTNLCEPAGDFACPETGL